MQINDAAELIDHLHTLGIKPFAPTVTCYNYPFEFKSIRIIASPGEYAGESWMEFEAYDRNNEDGRMVFSGRCDGLEISAADTEGE